MFLGQVVHWGDNASINSAFLVFGIIFLALIVLPPLHSVLRRSLAPVTYLTVTLRNRNQSPAPQIDWAFTCREQEIAELLCAGDTYRQIASQLMITENTVRSHVKSIYHKCGVQSRGELVQLLRPQR